VDFGSKSWWLYNLNLGVATKQLNGFLACVTAVDKGVLLTKWKNCVTIDKSKKRRLISSLNAFFRYLILLKITRLHELVLCYQK
jgi:hypothetical protein